MANEKMDGVLSFDHVHEPAKRVKGSDKAVLLGMNGGGKGGVLLRGGQHQHEGCAGPDEAVG